MTAQASDAVEYLGAVYSQAGACGEDLFDARELVGFRPTILSTACNRGYICRYRVDGDELKLIHLHCLISDPDKNAPLLFGRFAARASVDRSGCDYEGLDHAVAFSGGMLIGADLIPELYGHLGHQAPYRYRRLFELIFDRGRLQGTRDRSREVAEFRASCLELGAGGFHPPSWEDEKRWITQAFSREYRW